MAQWLFIPTRIVHIVAGVAWVGSSLLFATFVVPTAAAMGPTHGVRFLNRLLDRAWFSLYFTAVEALTVLSGLVLYWNISGGFQAAWITSTPGLTFTVGAGAALVALVVSGRVSQLLGQLYRLDPATATDDPQQDRPFSELHRSLSRTNAVYVTLLLVAVIAMASARYL